MTCTACGEKPKNTAKDFTKAVIEINNPEKLVLLRKVVIPVSMGDETQIPPAIGKYSNVLLQYEVNGHIYLYSSDGIPTAIEANVPQEVWDAINELELDVGTLDRDLTAESGARERGDAALQQEIDDLKNSPDVVDIVATYADLMAYDTSGLGDNDVIRVLRDETHDGQSSYYRWSTTTQTWTFIGTVGDYYTKQQVDTLLDEKQDELTPGDNISIEDESGALVISATDTTYSAGSGLSLSGTTFSVDTSTIATKADLDNKQDVLTAGDNITIEDESGDLVISATDTTYTAGTGISINNGVISATSTGPTVVQTTGASTTDVMSQNAVTNTIFNISSFSANNSVRIGNTASSYASTLVGIGITAQGNDNTVIGKGATSSLTTGYGVAIGESAAIDGSGPIAIGYAASATARGSIALGSRASATQQGEMNIGTSSTSSGYNSSNYRLLTGLYDGQSAHDAVTKGQMDTELSYKQDELTPGSGISITDESGALVISATGAQIATINAQDWSALWQ